MRVRWKRRRKKRAPRPLLVRIGIWCGAAVLTFYLLCTSSLLLLRSYNPMTTAVQAQRRVESFFESGSYKKRQTFVRLEQLPPHVQHAVIAAEDGAFYKHSGIDWAELRLVFREYRRHGRLRGASTISQQLVKNLYLTTHRSIVRKLLEFMLVPLAEGTLSKDRILELYLNVIEWGPGVYGIEAAAQYHYSLPVSELSREQAARLAACIPSPRIWRPERMDEYSAEILDRMSQRGW